MSVVFKAFSTPGGDYVFDRETNSIVAVSKDDYISFRNIEAKNAAEKDYQILQSFQSKGFCKESRLKTIEHPDLKHIGYYLNHKLERLTLQVTQSCNLRCEYCVYGGGYSNHRIHSNKTMSLDTMIKAVDFYMARSKDTPMLDVAFYGGEPLLEIDNIKKCVEYISERYGSENADIIYSMTTNGTLLNNEDTIRFLYRINANVTISLDGPEEYHDAHRVYANGKGSFCDIINNLQFIKKHYPEFYRKIRFNSIVAPGHDVSYVKEFFAGSLFQGNHVKTDRVSETNSTETIIYDDKYFISTYFERTKLLLSKIGVYGGEKESKTTKVYFDSLKLMRQSLKAKKNGFPEAAHPRGPCVAGAQRLFVNVNGDMYPCEKVAEGSVCMKIGSLTDGFDTEKVREMTNIGKITENECMGCWAFSLCGMCAVLADGEDGFSRETRLRNCRDNMFTLLSNLKTICVLYENGYDFEEIDH